MGEGVRKTLEGLPPSCPWAGFTGLPAPPPRALCFLHPQPHSRTPWLWLQSCQPRLHLEEEAVQNPRTAGGGGQAERMASEEISEDRCGTLRSVRIQMCSHAGTLSFQN